MSSKKRYFVDIPVPLPENPTQEQLNNAEWKPAGPEEGFKRRKDAVDWCAKMYGAVGGKVQLVSSSEGEEEDETPDQQNVQQP